MVQHQQMNDPILTIKQWMKVLIKGQQDITCTYIVTCFTQAVGWPNNMLTNKV